MSHVTRPKPTYMLVCDLCDQEIDRETEGGDSRGNLMHNVRPAPGTVTSKTNHGILCWPRTRRPTSRPDLDQGVKYDFHGRCIADLIKATIDARIARTPSATEGGW